jgi:hypothetical protein
MPRRLPAHTASGLANVGAAALLLVACGREPTVPFADGGSGRGLGLDAVWQARGFQGVSIPATDAAHVYVRDAGRVVRAFDKRTGAPRWQRPLPADAGSPNARLATTAGLVLVGGDATLLALDAATGADRWRFRGDATESAGALVPAVDDSTVYLAALGSARVYAVDARTGQTRWATAVAPPVSGAPLTQVSASAYYPVLDDERVFVTYIRFHARDQQPGNQGGVAAVSRRTGELLWRYEFVRRDPPLNVGTGIGNPTRRARRRGRRRLGRRVDLRARRGHGRGALAPAVAAAPGRVAGPDLLRRGGSGGGARGLRRWAVPRGRSPDRRHDLAARGVRRGLAVVHHH